MEKQAALLADDHSLVRVRILLVDDHAVVRAGYRTLLKSSPHIEVGAEAESGEQAYSLYKELAPDVVIMDLTLPGMGGLEAIRRIIQYDPQARILVFSMHDDTAFVAHALQAGAQGYVTKSSAPDILVEAALRVASGDTYLDHDSAKRLALQKSRGQRRIYDELSSREFEIFCLLAEGLNTASIAQRLPVSYKTIANCSTRIKAKLNVGTHAELVHLAIRHGIVQA